MRLIWWSQSPLFVIFRRILFKLTLEWHSYTSRLCSYVRKSSKALSVMTGKHTQHVQTRERPRLSGLIFRLIRTHTNCEAYIRNWLLLCHSNFDCERYQFNCQISLSRSVSIVCARLTHNWGSFAVL